MAQRQLSLAVLAVYVASTADAWGPEGHWISGRVAGDLLGKGALAKASSLLDGASLEDVASWADIIREKHAFHWSERLHFIDLPDKVCAFDYDRDCKEDVCVAGAILNYTHRLKDGSLPQEERTVALKFLIHFMGDIHQPLHVGWTSDRGGNKIHVKEGFAHDKPENLHAVWDSGILDQFETDHEFKEQGYAKMLLEAAKAQGPETEKWAACGEDVRACVLEAAGESAALACGRAYRDESGGLVESGEELTEAYYEVGSKAVSSRLAAAAVRLASVLAAALADPAEVAIVV